MMKNKFTLTCVAPDGERIVEGFFDSVESAWKRANDMGSRWFFYPVSIVCGSAYRNPRIVAVPDGMSPEWVGRAIKTLQKAFAANSEHVCDWLNGKCPLELCP